jgi:hypothetical protein
MWSKASNVKTCVVSYLLKTSTISFDILSVILELNRFLLMACFNAYLRPFCSCALSPSYFLGSYIPHNTTTSLLHYVNILQNLKKVKGVAIEYAKYFIRSMIGFLYYVKYKESNKMVALLTSKRLIKKSLNLDVAPSNIWWNDLVIMSSTYSK